VKLIRPRLTDHHNIFCTQSEADFAIPFLDEDIPLYVDPFLLWKSPAMQDNALHTALINSFNNLGVRIKNGQERQVKVDLIKASECDEVGLGLSKTRTGQRITEAQAEKIIDLFRSVPQYHKHGFSHFEEIQFYVDGIARDRISDFTCNFLKSFLIDFTIDQCQQIGLPTMRTNIDVYNYKTNKFIYDYGLDLPVHPTKNTPLLLVPKRWLSFSPWISIEEYFKDYCPHDELVNPGQPLTRSKVLSFNRDNYGLVETYVKAKERTAESCQTDPLFKQIPVLSAKRKFRELKKLTTGKEQNADKDYEDIASDLMASLLYPHLDFADVQARTDSGVLIRDLIFYNNKSMDFLGEIFQDYGSRQLVFELKNVKFIERDHINQLNRYLQEDFGRFGVLLTRNPLSKAMFRNTIDLWSGQRRCIIALSDSDIELMVSVFESRQRSPIEVLKKKYIEFRRACPS
jgi:hypothetical protein